MTCKICSEELAVGNIYPDDHRYCIKCGIQHKAYLTERRQTLTSLRNMNLESKIIQTKFLIHQTVLEFGIDNVYISYSGGRDSTVLSHITKNMYPNILHIFANTTNEYPETLQHIKWEKEENKTNLITVIPRDAKGEIWTFKKVVEHYGYPMYSKRVSNAIRTYQHALSSKTKQNSLDYMNRNFKKYYKYKELPISDKCCDKLKKNRFEEKLKNSACSVLFLEFLLLKAINEKKIGWNMAAMYSTNARIINQDPFHFGQMRTFLNI